MWLCGGPARAQHTPAGPAAQSDQRPPDVIIVMVDTLRADALDYGDDSATSPALATFARSATRFSRAYAQASWTAPSVASFLTSRYPAELGMFKHPRALPAKVKTMAEVMQARGYGTVGVTTNPFITSRNGFSRGFDDWDETLMPGRYAYTSDAVTDRILNQADRVDPDTPLFVYAHYFDPHYDYVLHKGFEPDGLPAPGQDHVSIGILMPKVKHRAMELTETDLTRIRRHYASEVAFTDHHIGRLLDGLATRGRFEGAVVVVTADHGEAFTEHGHIGHTVNVFDELIHVPLLIKAPHQSEATVTTAPVALIDTFPTVLALAGLPPAPDLRGLSLTHLHQSRPVFSVTHRPRLVATVIDGTDKLIYTHALGRHTLFDLARDPFELFGAPQSDADGSGRLADALDLWLSGLAPSTVAAPVTISTQEQALLRALGYGD